MIAPKTVTVVVTGSSGYLGRKVVAGLKELGVDVIEIDKHHNDNPIDLSKSEDRKKLFLPKDYHLIHLAFPLPGGLPSRKFESLIEKFNSNISSWFNPKSTLFVSSTAVYPINTSMNDTASPWEIYGRLKYQSELFFLEKFDSVTIFRPGTLVEHNRESSMMKFIMQLKNSPFPIMPGRGEIIHPFTHTSDLVSAILMWVMSPKESQGIFNLTALQPLTLKQLSLIGRTKKSFIVFYIPRFFLTNIGSDRFPIGKISRWHFRALCYDFKQDSSNNYRDLCRSYENLFTS
jgi:nucleoside-diphosphate-sugar epimerase